MRVRTNLVDLLAVFFKRGLWLLPLWVIVVFFSILLGFYLMLFKGLPFVCHNYSDPLGQLFEKGLKEGIPVLVLLPSIILTIISSIVLVFLFFLPGFGGAIVGTLLIFRLANMIHKRLINKFEEIFGPFTHPWAPELLERVKKKVKQLALAVHNSPPTDPKEKIRERKQKFREAVLVARCLLDLSENELPNKIRYWVNQ